MGKQKIVISEQDNIAVLFEDDAAVEFIIHRGDVLLGDVYLAQVENILPSIDAAFVNVGTERMGFLHSSDVLGKGDLKSRLQPKQNLVVQVMKEPTGHKGPRVTMNVALPGRFLVMMPESKGISISRKIVDNKERARLKSIVSLIKPPGVGVIIRTEAENQAEPEIQEDLETLVERWQQCVAMADTAKPPALLYRDQDLLYRVIREMVTEDVKEIVVDTAFGQQRAQQLLQNWGIDQPIKVSLYQGQQNIMVGCSIDKEIKMALQTKVPLPSGGYLYIQPTEALTVVDVNSGKFTSLESQAETIRLTNLEAAKEIARQLRLRNIGGMMIVDFIDMESRANQLAILEYFESELANDKAKPQIGQLSDLGLVEMTRHRQGQSLSEIFTKRCIACSGSGLNIEDFNWAPSNSEMSRGRTKMPIRSQRDRGDRQQKEGDRQQQQQVQGGDRQQKEGGDRQQQGKQPLPKPGAPTLRKVLLSAQPEGMPVWENFIQQSHKIKAQEEKAATEALPLDELYHYRLVKNYGIRFASIVKLAFAPVMINSVLIRINPHINDVFTLVYAIEGSSTLPIPLELEEEESAELDIEAEPDDVEAEATDEAVSRSEREPQRERRDRRHHRERRPMPRTPQLQPDLEEGEAPAVVQRFADEAFEPELDEDESLLRRRAPVVAKVPAAAAALLPDEDIEVIDDEDETVTADVDEDERFYGAKVLADDSDEESDEGTVESVDDEEETVDEDEEEDTSAVAIPPRARGARTPVKSAASRPQSGKNRSRGRSAVKKPSVEEVSIEP